MKPPPIPNSPASKPAMLPTAKDLGKSELNDLDISPLLLIV